MRKNLKIIIDIDDVLLKCNETALEWLERDGYGHHEMTEITRWGSINPVLDKRMAYFSEPTFVMAQKPYEGAREFITELSKRAEILVATNVPAAVAGQRLTSITKIFPEIKVSNVMFSGRKDLLVADLMLDDCISNLENAAVTYPVLFQRPWNKDNTGMLSVSDYTSFLKLVDTIRSGEEEEGTEGIILVGPSGSGKKEIAESLIAKGYERVKTYSTKDDYHYITMSEEEFNKLDLIEQSVYMGYHFGVTKASVDAIVNKGKKPLLIMDINGAIALRDKYHFAICFVKANKADCIKDILKRGLPIEEATRRITSIDRELRNEEFCDFSVTSIEELEGRLM